MISETLPIIDRLEAYVTMNTLNCDSIQIRLQTVLTFNHCNQFHTRYAVFLEIWVKLRFPVVKVIIRCHSGHRQRNGLINQITDKCWMKTTNF